MSWLPLFLCTGCGSALATSSAGCLVCVRCGLEFERRDQVWRFLAPTRAEQLAPFARQYRIVREKEGRRQTSAAYYRMLPNVASDDPQARDWRIRQETYRHLLGHVFAAARQPSTVLDLGAGSAWLSHRLATLGHKVVAVDAIEDEADGLGAVRFYDTPIVAVQADFDALPFVPKQFDLVVFNGSLHYASDAAATLARARRMLATDGALVVMDSPMFRRDRDGAAMIDEKHRHFRHDLAIANDVRAGVGYLTFARLSAIAQALDLRAQFVPTRGPLPWRVRRQFARVRLRRAPAAFGLWMAR